MNLQSGGVEIAVFQFGGGKLVANFQNRQFFQKTGSPSSPLFRRNRNEMDRWKFGLQMKDFQKMPCPEILQWSMIAGADLGLASDDTSFSARNFMNRIDLNGHPTRHSLFRFPYLFCSGELFAVSLHWSLFGVCMITKCKRIRFTLQFHAISQRRSA